MAMQLLLDEFNLNDPENGIVINPDITGLSGLPDIRTSQGVNTGRDGGWTGNQLFDARFISVIGRIFSHTVADVEKKRRDLATLLAKKELRLTYVTEGGSTYSTIVRVLGMTAPISRPTSIADFKIDLKADDPLLYDFTSGTGIIAILNIQRAAGGFPIPLTFPLEIGGGPTPTVINNSGTSTVSPLIRIIGPVHSPVIVNRTTNQTMAISVDLEEGSQVDINTAMSTITRDGQDIFNLLSGDFIKLASGDNIVSLSSSTPDDTGHAEIEYNSGFIGT